MAKFGKKDELEGDGGAPMKKADVILQNESQLSAKQDELINQTKLANSRLDSVIDSFSKNKQFFTLLSRQSAEMFEALKHEYEELKREILYLAKQSESIFETVNAKLEQLSASISGTTATANVDSDEIARKVAEALPAGEQISADYIASKVAEQIVIPDGGKTVVAAGVPLNIDEEELADRIALKVGAVRPEEFDLIVDDEGCGSLAKEVCEKLDYEVISAEVAERLRSALEIGGTSDNDYDEMASRISEKITVAGVNEDAIADKAAAVLSNYLPEIDTDEIADKVTASVLSALPASMDSEAIVSGVSEKLIESQEDHDYDIVIDEDGVDKISDSVHGRAADRFDKVDRGISEIKAMLAAGAIARVAETAAAEPYAAEEPADETLVTVSDIVEPAAEADDEDDDVIDEIVEDIDEQPADGEIMPDGIPGISGDVDFTHMMKYNRSFIARIIQGTDEQKQYYGEVKQALLSYNKVNSNVAWGAERFHKGRETIARFKIRGKTLCLYLALAPDEFKTSVYHQVDVSDNKSMHGTPMMVKIKSPLGVKKAIRLIDEMLARRGGVKRNLAERDYAAMYPYETIDELIEDGLVKDVSKK